MAKRITRRQPHLALRLFVTALLVGVTVAAYSNAVGNISLNANKPDDAYGRVGLGLFPAGRIADGYLVDQQNLAALPEAARLARLSLEAQTLNPQALRVIGVAADHEGHGQQALALIEMSDRLSRRDLGTQLWLVNHHALLNDAGEALRHYDTAMRASAEIQPVLFPILQHALGVKEIRAAFAPYVRGNAPWLTNFIAFQVSSSADPSNVALAIIDAKGLPSQPDSYRGQESQLLAQLSNTKHFDTLRAFFASLRGAQPESLTSAAFLPALIDEHYQPVSWKISEAAAISSAFEDDPQSAQKQFHVMAGTGEHGVAASKLLLLPSGHYRIASPITFLRHGTGSALTWSIKCATTNSELQHNDVGSALRTAALEFDVAKDCPAQILDLVVSGGDPVDGSEAYVHAVTLTRLGDALPPKVKPNQAPPAITRTPTLF